MALPDLDAWQLESLRLTAFSSGVLAAKDQNWWQQCTGSPPESSGSRLQQGEYFEAGPFLGGTLEMKVSFNRLDWMLTPVATVGAYPSLGNDVEQRANEFISQAIAWISSLNFPVIRIACGLVALRRVETRAEANRTIKEYVRSLTVDEKKVRDLAIQLSYPIQSTTAPDVEISCLSKWMSIQVQLFTMQPGAIGMPALNTQLFARSEFDVFTPAERVSEIPRDHVKDLGLELAGTALEQLRNGVTQ